MVLFKEHAMGVEWKTGRVTAVFLDPADARAALDQLDAVGFPAYRVSLITNENECRRVRASMGLTEDGTEPGSAAGSAAEVPSRDSKMLEGLALGMGAGVTAGLLAGGLTAVGTIGAVTGGVGLLAAGPVAIALAVGSLGGVAGGTIGAAIGSAIPERDAESIERAVIDGGVLVSAICADPSEAAIAAKAFRGSNAAAVIDDRPSESGSGIA